MFYQAQVKKTNFIHLLQGMYHGYTFFVLFFAISVDPWWVGFGAFILRIKNIPLRKTYVFRLLRLKFHCSARPQGISNLPQ